MFTFYHSQQSVDNISYYKVPLMQGTANVSHAGHFIYSRLFAFEGAYGMVNNEFDNYFVSNEYPTFNCNAEKILPEFLYAYFKSPTVWKDVALGSKGLGDRHQRVQPQQILTHRFMLPPIEYQYGLRQLMAKAVTLKRLPPPNGMPCCRRFWMKHLMVT